LNVYGKSRPRPLELIGRASVFRREQLADGRSDAALARTLHYHVSTGRLTNIRRGVYASNSYGQRIDPYALAACLAADSVVAYAGALHLHYFRGRPDTVELLTRERLGRFSWDAVDYRGVLPPQPVRDSRDFGGHVTTVERQGVRIRVTTPERSFVDCLDRLDLGTDLNLLWDYFRSTRVNPRAMMRYACDLGNRVAAARVGILLLYHPLLRVNDDEVGPVEAMRPATPGYMDPMNKRPGQYLASRWNLYVPDKLAARIFRH
jgi:predicted transcriptional regulator of viral defense system